MEGVSWGLILDPIVVSEGRDYTKDLATTRIQTLAPHEGLGPKALKPKSYTQNPKPLVFGVRLRKACPGLPKAMNNTHVGPKSLYIAHSTYFKLVGCLGLCRVGFGSIQRIYMF